MIGTVLRLDIGGQTFATTLGTVAADPGSKLAKCAYDKWLSSGGVAPTVFIDRDPTHFRYILNYLRDGEQTALPTTKSALRELLREAEFYELKQLQKKIRLALDDGRTSTGAISIEPEMTDETIGPADWTPKVGDMVRWSPDGFREFRRSLDDQIVRKGYVDWLFCRQCDNDYQLRLPELPDVLFGWRHVEEFLADMRGKLDSYVNEKCVYVNWKNVYCRKDGYLESVRFMLHVPLAHLEPQAT